MVLYIDLCLLCSLTMSINGESGAVDVVERARN